MASISFLLLVFLVASATSTTIPTQEPSKTYIVITNQNARPRPFPTLGQWYASMMPSTSRILYTYDAVMHGFAVSLTDHEARVVAGINGVAAVHESRVLYAHTTRSPAFLGLSPALGAWPETNYGDGIIVGVIDSGISPEHLSFNDSGLRPVRTSWRGRCAPGAKGSFSCNNKIVGARSFIADEQGRLTSPRDVDGHGTHVAATAAGARVRDAGIGAFSRGAASGVAPRARLSIYKACTNGSCSAATVVAAIEAAVQDGVHVLCLPVGSDSRAVPLYEDPVAVATFGAERMGISVVVSGGNGGPAASTVNNAAPWVVTVGAVNQDRMFPAKLKLGNGKVLTGQSLYKARAKGTPPAGLVHSECQHAEDVTPDLVTGKIVVCRRYVTEDLVLQVQSSGGAGIVAVDGRERRSDCVAVGAIGIPGLSVGNSDAETLASYMASAPNPTASFSFTCETVTGENRAPIVAGFSSRGANWAAPEILKPDVVAPGINILAAWPVPSNAEEFQMMSGTSVACAHVAGVAALICSRHSQWSPAMVRSAIVTGASTLDSRGDDVQDDGATPTPNTDAVTASPFVAGAGLVQPHSSADTGLVYDATVDDYVDFMCTLGYTEEQVRLFQPDLPGCGGRLPGGVADLNMPSLVVVFDDIVHVRTVTCTVTHVVDEAEVYPVKVAPLDGVEVTVTPSALFFNQLMEKQTYTVVFRKYATAPIGSRFGRITWKSDAHKVISPVVVLIEA